MFVLAKHFTMSPIIFSASIVSMLFTLTTFNDYKNLVLGILGRKTSSHITTDSALAI